MKYNLKFSNKFRKAISVLVLFSVYVLIDIFFIAALDIIAFLIMLCFITVFDWNLALFMELFKLTIIIEVIFIIFIEIKRRSPYVKITPKGVLIYNSNGVHFGLRQYYRLNAVAPYDRIVSCKIGIPVDCPPNYRYQRYNTLFMIKRYFDLKHGKDVSYMKEPAIAGGRYDEECILLELDNKRIIVIPIDECSEFLEQFNKYFEQYKELQKKKEGKK